MKNLSILLTLLVLISVVLPGCSTKRDVQPEPIAVILPAPSLPVPTVPEVIELHKGWFDEYNKIVMEEIKTKTHLLKWNGDPVFWYKFLHALAASESALNPTDTYWEKGINSGVDPKTGDKYLSEGLFQLSYVDHEYYGCAFDRDLDRGKPEHDPSKTIFNPAEQIRCTLTIMNKLTGKKGSPIFNSGNYWSTLMPRRTQSHKNFKYYYKKYVGVSL